MAPKAHAVLGASKAERWMNCPGSVRMEEGLPGTESVHAKEGTEAHALAESLLSGDAVWPYDGVDEKAIEMYEAVKVFVDFVREHAEGKTLFVEQRFNLASLNPPADMFGTADVVIWDEAEADLHIVDYKHGAGVVVDAHENLQLIYYALGAVLALGRRPKTITVTIVQPRGFHSDGTIRSYTFAGDELKVWKDRLFEGAERTQDPNAPLQVGPWCRWCKALPTCPAQRANAVAVAQSEFDAIEPPSALTPEQLGKVLHAAPRIREWLDAAEAHALTTLQAGGEVPGFKVVQGRQGNRQWTSNEEVTAYFKRKRIPAKQYQTVKLISPAQAEKIGLDVEGLTTRWPGKPKLAPTADPSPALLSAADEFEATSDSPERAEP